MSSVSTLSLLSAARSGEARAADVLFERVYGELRRLSGAQVAAEAGAATLTPTALVHETYLKLLGESEWVDRTHFLRVAARAMRQILTDRARARKAARRGGDLQKITLQDDLVAGHEAPLDHVLAVNDALEQLEARDARLAHLVELRFYAGMDIAEVAAVLGTSPRTTARDWARAKAYLRSFLG